MKIVFPTTNAASLNIFSYNENFVAISQKNRSGWCEDEGYDLIIINKKEWNEFVHNLTLFDYTK